MSSLIEGTTLHQVLAQRCVLGTEEAIRLSRQICSGLDYADSHGIVHRDVKAREHHDRGERHAQDHGFWHCQDWWQCHQHRPGAGNAELHHANGVVEIPAFRQPFAKDIPATAELQFLRFTIVCNFCSVITCFEYGGACGRPA
jgi:Protein tyrosine and serine/threonine kinase